MFSIRVTNAAERSSAWVSVALGLTVGAFGMRRFAGSTRYPDFTIDDAETGQTVFLEHLGMMAEPAYGRRWERKLDWYRARGVLPTEEGGGESGVLVTTTEEHGIDSALIQRQLKELLAV